MSDCCGDKKSEGCCCGDDAPKKNILFYACSGGANVGEAADRAAREMMYKGCGTMFCLAGLGAGIEGMIQTARDADLNVVIDGCSIDCAKKIFGRTGITNYRQLDVTKLGVEKAKGVPCTDDDVAKVVAGVYELLAAEGLAGK